MILISILGLYLFIGFACSYEQYARVNENEDGIIDIHGWRSYFVYYIVVPLLWLPYMVYHKTKRIKVWVRRRRALMNNKFINNY